MMQTKRRRRLLAGAALAGIMLFVAGFVAGAIVQRAGYDWTRHDISDLAALTASAPWVMLAGQAVGGAATIAFAIWALRPALALPGEGGAFGAWLVAGSLIGLDNVSDVFFRLDCMAANPHCTQGMSTASPAGTLHLLAGGFTALLSVAAPFVLLPRLRRVPGWGDLATPTVVVGIALFVSLVAYVALENHFGQGIAQRVMILICAAWIAALALRVRRLEGTA